MSGLRTIAAAALAASILAGCSSTYEVRVSGEVHRAHLGAGAPAGLVSSWPGNAGSVGPSSAGAANAAPVPGARVTVALEFARGEPVTLGPVAPAADGSFVLERRDDDGAGSLRAVHIRVEAPGYECVEKTLTPCKICSNGENYLSTHVDAALEPKNSP